MPGEIETVEETYLDIPSKEDAMRSMIINIRKFIIFVFNKISI